MTIYVVTSADGDIYFAGNRAASINRAYDTAATNVLSNAPRLGGLAWEQEEVDEVSALKASASWDKLYAKLEEIGAIRQLLRTRSL